MTSLVIDVRPARASDGGALSDVYAAAWREAYSGIIPALTLERMICRRGPSWWRATIQRRAVLVLEAGGEIAGYATFGPAHNQLLPGAAEIQELYLAPEYQGIGLGKRLFAGALRTIRSKGYAMVVVRALAEIDRANEFYTRRGGRLLARTEEALGGRALPCFWYEFAS